MPAIRIGNHVLTLAGNASLPLERNSPLLSEPGENGSSSQAFRIARTPANSKALGFPARFDQRAGGPPAQLNVEALDDAGNGLTVSNLIFRGVEPDAFLYNLEFGDSAVMSRLKSRTLQQFRFGGLRSMEPAAGRPASDPNNGPLAVSLFQHEVIDDVASYDFTFAPFSNYDNDGQYANFVETIQQQVQAGQPNVPALSQNFNVWAPYANNGSGYGFGVPINVYIMGQLPNAYNEQRIQACPLPKLEYVVRTMFEELQLELETDVFDDPEMKQLVFVPVDSVLNVQLRPGAVLASDTTASFLIAQHLPAITGAKLLSALLKSFGWHFDATAAGRCRLLRAAPLVLDGNPVDITRLTGPNFTVETQEPTSVVVRNTWPEADSYAQQYAEQPDVNTILQPVASRAELPTPTAADQHRLVQEERRYYRSITTTDQSTPPVTTLIWERGPFYLPGQQVGTHENTEDYELGLATVLTTPDQMLVSGQLKAIDLLCFLEPSYTSEANEFTAEQLATSTGTELGTTTTRSTSIRLAFYRGMQPLGGLDASGNEAMIPWLTQRNLDPTARRIGNLTLEAHGQYGLVEQRLKPLLALRTASTLVKFPAYFTARQFFKLDLSRMVSIGGDEFMVRRLSLTAPVRQPGQLELVPRGQVEKVSSRPLVSDGFYTAPASGPAPGPTCTLLIDQVQRAGDVATVLVSQAQGQLRYQLDTGPLQTSNVFSGLVTGQQYTFWVYDAGVIGCHQRVFLTW